MRKLSHEEIVTRQSIKRRDARLPFVVVLNNIRSLYNVGSIFRSADGAGVAKIYCCGITGHPPNDRIAKTALGAEAAVPWEYREDVVELIKTLKQEDHQIILLEQIAGSIPYEAFEPAPPVCLIIGNEIEGVSRSLLEYCDGAIEIGMEGAKNSLNVSVAFGIVAFHIKNKLKTGSLTGGSGC